MRLDTCSSKLCHLMYAVTKLSIQLIALKLQGYTGEDRREDKTIKRQAGAELCQAQVQPT